MHRKPFLFYLSALLFLSVSGTFLLFLFGTNQQSGISFIDALFTSVSAFTLTGLEVVETAKTFSLIGQIIILFLIQTGGLFYVISTLYFGYLLKIKLAILPDYKLGFSYSKVLKIISLRVIVITVILETAAFVAVFSLWGRRLETNDFTEKIFYSFFHAISAFCNSGFTLLQAGFSNSAVNDLYVFHLALAVFIFLGALGFPAIYDIVSLKRLRERMITPNKNWELNTRISIYASFIFIFLGAILIYFFEKENALASQKTVEAGITSLFHSISARSAGFSSLFVTAFSRPLLWIFMVLMFIGGSAASMAGGIKFQTLYLIFFAEKSIFSPNNPNRRVLKVLSKALLISISLILLISFLLYLYADWSDNYIFILFETVSAFGNSGFYSGIVNLFSGFGKFLLILLMLSGKIIFPVFIFRQLLKQKS